MELDEDNIEEKMFDLFKTKNNWTEVYKELEMEANKTEKYSSIKSNLNPCFIYYLIKHKADLDQFSNVVSYIYNIKDEPHSDKGLNRFFNTRDTDLYLSQFVKLDKYNNDESVWDNIAFLFLDFDKRKPKGKQILLDQRNLPYLLAMTNEAADETVGVLWYAGFHGFISNFATNIEEIKPLIDMALNNPAFEKCLANEYSNFFNNLFQDIGRNSYEKELYPNQNKIIYKTLKKLVPNIDNVISKALFRNDFANEDKVRIDLGILNFCLRIEPEIDIVSKIDEKYKELYNEYKSKATGDEFTDLRQFDKVTSSFDSSLSVSLKKYNFELDCSKIDITKDYRDNYIYLKLLEIKITNEHDVKIALETAQYIIDLFEKEDTSNQLTSLMGINRNLESEIILPYLKTFVNYKKMDDSLEKKEEFKPKKNKV